MAETGFRFFLEALQALNNPPMRKRNFRPGLSGQKPLPEISETRLKPAVVSKQSSQSPTHRLAIRHANIADVSAPPSPEEDYTGSVCLLHILTDLFPEYREVLVDAEDLERLSQFRWKLVRQGRDRNYLRVTDTHGKYLHSVVMNAPKGRVVDHIFHRTLDTRKSQLRCCTVRENNINSQPRRNKPATKFKGVRLNKTTGEWFVHAGPRGGRFFIGGFDSEVAAAQAYNDLARKLYGTMAYQNHV